MIPKRYFVIPFEGLSEGLHHYSFEISDSFFEKFEGSAIEKGTFNVNLEMDKRSNMLVLQFDISGEAFIECDVCSDPLTVSLATKERLILKPGIEGEEISHEIVHIPESAYEIDVENFIYEFISLALPLKNVHKEGQCNPDAIELLNQLNAPENETRDPRWDQLNNIITDN